MVDALGAADRFPTATTKCPGNTVSRRSRSKPDSSARPIWLPVAAILVAGTLAFANGCNGAFVMDDLPCIVNNESLRQLWPPGKVLAPAPEALTVVGRPLLNLTFALNYAAHGLSLRGYHVVNIMIHLLAGVTLFDLIRRTLMLPSVALPAASSPNLLAGWIAILWTVHPLQTESVTYIVQRGEAMLGLFYLLTLWCLCRSATSPRAAYWHAAVVASALLAALVKEVIVTVVPVALLYDRAFLAASWREVFRCRWRMYVGLLLTWPLVAFLLSTTKGRGNSAGFGLGMTAWEYARLQCVYIPMYFKLSFWPHPLVLDYGRTPTFSTQDVAIGAAIVAVLVLSSLFLLWTRPQLGFLAVSIFLILSPTSSIVPLPGQVAAERRMYLPLAAVVTLAVLALQRVFARRVDQWPRVALTCAVISLVFIAVSRDRNRDYATSYDLWKATSIACPGNYRAHYNFGNEQVGRGEYRAAIASYDEAHRLNPKIPEVLANRAHTHLRLKEFAEARADLDALLTKHPNFVPGLYTLAEYHEQREDVAAAAPIYEKIAGLTPGDPDVHYYLGLALQKLGRHDEAIDAFDRALRLSPGTEPIETARSASARAIKSAARRNVE